MNYTRQYQNRINWQNKPSVSTPINETNLNKMDKALNYMDGKLSEAIGGGIVEANPSGSAMNSLNKIGINGVVYGISGGGGGSYTAGAGINIANNVIINTRKGALSGVIDEIISSGYAHTQINNALDSITAGGLVILKAETSGTANTVRIQYGEQASQSQAYRLCDTDLENTTINVSVDDMIILMFDTTGYKLIVLSILNNSGGGGLPETPLSIAHGGTGNTVGYIQTGRAGNTTIGSGATAEGGENEASGEVSHAEGSYNVASGNNSHAEGYGTTASDLFAHAEGYNTTASENAAHAEGNGTTASEWYAHAEGHSTTASGESSHAEGSSTIASNTGAHSEGVSTTASGSYSHAGGANSVASGSWSFAHGVKVTAGYNAQSVFGNRNNNKSNTLFEVGNGRWDANTGNDVYSNAFEVYNDGKASWDNGATKFQFTAQNGIKGYVDENGTFNILSKEVYFEQSVTLSTSTTTTVTFTNSAITATSVIDIAVSEWGLTPEDVTVSTGVCTVIMPKVSTAQTITVRIYVK